MLTHGMTPLLDKLAAEHTEVLPCTAHLTELASARSGELGPALNHCWPVLTTALDAHIEAEDDVLFPAVADAMGEEITALFREEHRTIQALRDELGAARRAGAGVERVSAIALRLADRLGAHMRREDAMLFPSARNTLR